MHHAGGASQDFRIISNLTGLDGSNLRKHLDPVSASTKQPLKARQSATDIAELPRRRKPLHDPSAPLGIPLNVLQRIESLGPVRGVKVVA